MGSDRGRRTVGIRDQVVYDLPLGNRINAFLFPLISWYLISSLSYLLSLWKPGAVNGGY